MPRGVRDPYLVMRPNAFLILLLLLLFGSVAFARGLSSGRGGPYMEYHSSSLGSFDSELVGNTVFLGGVGYGAAGKEFRIGGGGAAGFVWDGGSNIDYGVGYGGIVGEYEVSPWLNVGLMVGAGGYSISKIIAQTNSQVTFQKIASGAFVLFYPTVTAEVKLKKGWLSLGAKVGYFLPNESRLHSFTLGITLLFGKM